MVTDIVRRDHLSILVFRKGGKGSLCQRIFFLVESGKVYSKGTYYLACLVNFAKVGSSNLADILAASASYVGGGNRGQVYVRREGNDINQICCRLDERT